MSRTALWTLVSCLLADRLLKYIALTQSLLHTGEIVRFWFISFSPFLNHYLAFSIPLSLVVIIPSSLLIIAVLCFYSAQPERTAVQRAALFFIITGAASNVFDRIAYHGVIDYLSFWPQGFFNIADMMIGIGITALIFLPYHSPTH